jgi:hypothetical protein
VFWVIDRVKSGARPRLGLAEAGMAIYLGTALLSLLHADPPPPSAGAKLLGMAMLVALAAVTADLVPRLGVVPVARTVALTTLATAGAAVAGVVLFQLGIPTAFVGTYGDLVPGPYARAQAGLIHPNLLASYCIFAYGLVTRDDASLSPLLRRLALGAVALTSVLTMSRGILALGLAVLVRHADTRPRRLRAAVAAVLLTALVAGLTATNLSLDPLHPADARVLETPSPRRQALATSLCTLARHPWLGTGPGSSPGTRDGEPFDAHLTVLNVAATLGLPALLGLALVPVGLWRRRSRPTDLATWGMLAGMALESLAHDIEDFRHVWVAFGLAAADLGADRSTSGPRATLRPR